MAAVVVLGGCGSSSDGAPSQPIDDGGTTTSDAGAMTNDAGAFDDDGGGADAGWITADGGFEVPDAGVIRADRFITKVISFTPGDCGGFGIPNMPGVVMGPPVGGGESQGGLDVVSLGNAGEIVVSFEPNAIVDGPGVDLLVFENAFYAGGNPMSPFAEVGEVSVSDDGVTWTTFPCTSVAYPYGACAGWHAVDSNPMNGISPVDPAKAGGDPFDLADIGVTRARYVRVRDKTHEACSGSNRLTTNGFDLDAMAIVNAATP